MADPMNNNLLAAALAYAEMGYAVFPCIPGSKAPLAATRVRPPARKSVARSCMDENDNGTMANLYNHLDRWADRMGCCFVLIHHTTKGNQSGGTLIFLSAQVLACCAFPTFTSRGVVMSKLRLEWIEAGSLDGNPLNWRRHSPEQLQSIRDLLSDPDVGWAGACLYNERTKRLIDGHARKSVADPKTPVPVLVGDWSEEAEKKILATLDPVGAMATGDPAAYQALIEQVTAESLWVRDLLHNTQAALNAQSTAEEKPEDDAPSAVLPEMECQPFEHYDYIMLVFKNEQDFQQACERLEIKKVQVVYPGGLTKIGLGRVIDGAKTIQRWTGGH